MSNHVLAVIIKNPSNEEEFLLIKQTPPPKFGDEEYDSYVDSDLFDLPSVQLNPLSQDHSQIQLDGVELCADKVDLRTFDLGFALEKISEQLGVGKLAEERWKFWKYVEEPEFGPGPPINTVFISTKFGLAEGGAFQWMSWPKCVKWLSERNHGCHRLGPFVVNSFLCGSQHPKCVLRNLKYQEYPCGVMLLPMGSRTAKPFNTTNLIVVAPDIVPDSPSSGSCVANGDALIVDPGCSSRFHDELQHIVTALPKKLVVFVTHHHPDHVDGLSVIQRCNPDALLVAHENTMRRIRKDDWSLGYTSVAGGEEIAVRGQRFQVICAPGHTDGHMALLHLNTHALVVGDHCVGQGSAVLDIKSGGNMADYFQTTYKFMELSPHVLIPLHGRVNLWPKHMLCQYLKNRRNRESSILKVIDDGGLTLFDIVSMVYKDVDRRLWIPAASNVMLHVEYLAQQKKLPEGFNFEAYERSIATFFDGTSNYE